MTHSVRKIEGKHLVMITLSSLLFACLLFYVYVPYRLHSDDARIKIPYENRPRLGEASAPVRIMEFADFKCPACKTFHDKILPRIEKEYIQTGKVSFYFTNFQWIGNDSVTAGMIGKSIYYQNPTFFWKYYDLIYTHQKSEHENWATVDFLFKRIKEDIPEVNLKKVFKDLEMNRYYSMIEAELVLSHKLRIDEVPALFVNGRKVTNPLDYAEIKKKIEDELQ